MSDIEANVINKVMHHVQVGDAIDGLGKVIAKGTVKAKACDTTETTIPLETFDIEADFIKKVMHHVQVEDTIDGLGKVIAKGTVKAKACDTTETASKLETSDEDEDHEEPHITNPSKHQYALFPIKHYDCFENFTSQYQRYWTPDEIDLSKDTDDWRTMNKYEQFFILVTLSFFANSDNVVLKNLITRLMKEIAIPEAIMAFAFQGGMEAIHVLSYNLLIDNLVEDEKQKEEIFNAVEKSPIVKPKLQWADKWITSNASLARRLFAWAVVEGVFFSSSFCSIFWLRKRKLLPGVCFANEKIVEDEYLHVALSAMLYRKCNNKLSTEEAHDLMKEAVEVEHFFVEQALPVRLIGMNAETMKQYVCYVADLVLQQLGHSKFYNVHNPFLWMEGIGLVGKANFFEKRVGEYIKQDVAGTEEILDYEELDF